MNKYILLSACCFIVFKLSPISRAMVFPGTDWDTRSPESQGISTELLDEAMGYLHDNGMGVGTNEALVVRNGYIIWQGPNVDVYHSIYSGTKTFTTTVLGLLIQEGVIASIDSPAVDYYPQLDDHYATYAGILFRHLANFTSGYNADITATADMKFGDPRLFLTPTYPQAAPGARFRYFDPAIHQLGYILTVASGETLEGVFQSRVADPIGMSLWEWKHLGYSDNGAGTAVVAEFLNPSGIYGGGIHTTARELARYGHLYLNRGNWDGVQLIDADWVDQATTNQVPTSLQVAGYDSRGQYGFMWWTNGIDIDGNRRWPSAPPKTYTLIGNGQNYCFVVPEWNMVIVRMTPPGSSAMPSLGMDAWEGFFSILSDGVTDPSGVIDACDLPDVAADLGRTDCDAGEACKGDVDEDYDIDGLDLFNFAVDVDPMECPE